MASIFFDYPILGVHVYTTVYSIPISTIMVVYVIGFFESSSSGVTIIS